MGCFRVEELLKAGVSGYVTFLGLRPRETEEIDQALRWHLTRAAQRYLLPIAGSDAIVESIVREHPPVIGPGLTFRLPVSTHSTRAWVTAHSRVEQVALDTKVRKS